MKIKVAFGIGVATLIVSVILAITFHIVQYTHQGCWTGSEIKADNINGTNLVYPNGYVLCCNSVSNMDCLWSVSAHVDCQLYGTGSYCKKQMCQSCIALWVIAALALITSIITFVIMKKKQQSGGYGSLE